MELTTPEPIHVECGRFSGVLSLIGDKWTVMIVLTLTERPRRFNEIKRTIGGISQQMLARTLRALERDGMLARTVYPTVPPDVEYARTDLGCSLAGPIRQLGYWASAHVEEIEGKRSAFDAAKDISQVTR